MAKLQDQFELLAWKFIASLQKHPYQYSSSTISKHTHNLFGGSICLVKCFSSLKIKKPSDLKFDHHIEIYKMIMGCTGLEESYRSGYVQTSKMFVKYLMQIKILEKDEYIPKIYLEKRKKFKIPMTLTEEKQRLITDGIYSEDSFIQLRQQCGNRVIVLGNAARMEVELKQLLREDVEEKSNELLITITGKNGKRRSISVCEKDKDIVRAYTYARDFIVDLYHINEPAFFIKRYPTYDENKNTYSLALTKAGHYQAIRRFMDSHEELKTAQPYDLRRYGITRMVEVAAICQIPIEEVAVQSGYCKRFFPSWNG